MENAEHAHDNIIIVKRKSHGDHGHHGGAWKIAYADFVTAMMAFFLVMWLINAANEKTRAQVASYFNPIKLTDTSTAKKGLNNPVDKTVTPSSEKTPSEVKAEEKPEKPAEKKPEQAADGHFSDEQLFRNPYGILGLLAGQATKDLVGHAAKGLAIVDPAIVGEKDGQSFRDPFDPYAWRALVATQEALASETEATPSPEAVITEKVESAFATNEVTAKELPAIDAPVETQQKTGAEIAPEISTDAKSKVPETKLNPDQPVPQQIEAPLHSQADVKEATLLQGRITKLLKDFSADEVPTIEVNQTSEGILISLTDNLAFDMFDLGSAQPQPKLVLVMEKVASVVKEYSGTLVIRGHTDSRPYRNGAGDNWRLSTSRAQMAFYMLKRAGLDENKVERIEGYADHKLKFPDLPEKSANRRIELLLKAQAK